MMMLLLACTLSLAGPDVSAAPNPDAKDTLDEPVDLGSLGIDARVPVEVLVDGHKMVQLYTSGHVKLNVAPGHRRLRIYVNGTPEEHAIEILPTGAALVIVGRTGITTGQTSPAACPCGHTPASPRPDRLSTMPDKTTQPVATIKEARRDTRGRRSPAM